MKKNFSIKEVTALGIGIALFVVASYIIIPTPIPNTSIQPRIAILAFFATLFGPVVGFLVGFLGHAIADAVQYGSVWWSWVISEGIFGLIVGFFAYKLNIENVLFNKTRAIIFNIIQLIANIICWLIIAPVLDILIYAEPAKKVFLQGVVSTILNFIIVAIVSTLLIRQYSKMKVGHENLKEED